MFIRKHDFVGTKVANNKEQKSGWAALIVAARYSGTKYGELRCKT
jgi:hypothetical protein